jgi:hypothetical protein
MGKPESASSQAATPPSAVWGLAITSLVFAALFYRIAFTAADPDLWGHLRFGLDILHTGQIIQEDSYSYLTQGCRWINHEWLAETLFGVLYTVAGSTGMIVFKVALGLLVLGILYGFLCRQGLDVLRAGIVLLLVTVLCMSGLGTIRPHMFTYLGFPLLLLIIRAADQGRLRWLWAVPAMIALWVNLHGGVLAGLAVLLVWAALHLATTVYRAGLKRLLSADSATVVLTAALSLLATVVNPYGWELPVFLVRTTAEAPPDITEWAPLRLLSAEGAAYLALLALCVAGWLGSRRRRSPALLAVFACLAVAPLLAVRHLPLFAVSAVVLSGEHIADAWGRWLPGDSQLRLPRWLAIVCVLLAAALAAAGLPRLTCIHLDKEAGLYPLRAVALLKQSGVEGNVAVHFDWGEYVLWHLGPRVKVSIDGRRDTVFSDDVYMENVRFRQGEPDWDAVVRRPETDLALVSKHFPVFKLMNDKQSGWNLVYEDPICGLFARKGSVHQRQLRQVQPEDLPVDGVGTCFP